MEDGAEQDGAGYTASRTPPPPPEPSADAALRSIDPSFNGGSNEPLQLDSEEWDITLVSALGALRMFISTLQNLANAMGDVPPTPPISRPGTPRQRNRAEQIPQPADEGGYGMRIESLEVHLHAVGVGGHAEDIIAQHVNIARRFFSKTAPSFSLSEYLLRLHYWCPHSPGVYLAAAAYCQRLCVADGVVPATNRTVHRLALAAIRVAAKALEDNQWPQDRIAKVGGVGRPQLMSLEITLCFLMDFELALSPPMLAKRMFLLQQAERKALGIRERRLEDST